MAEPKKRTNNSKQGMRRMHDHVKKATIVACDTCKEPKEAHKVCYNCGTFKKTQVLENKAVR
jgi:large subunit ribosomal protein L32